MGNQSSSPATDKAPKAEPDATSADADAQPDEFPVTFDDWAAEHRAYSQGLIAGFRHTVRADGQLLAQRYRREWAADFETFKTTPPK